MNFSIFSKKITRINIIPAACGGFLVGVALQSWLLPAGSSFWEYLILLAASITVVVFWKTLPIRFCGIVVLAMAFGAMRQTGTIPTPDSSFVGSLAGREITLNGTVIFEPDVRLNNTKLTIGELRIVPPSSVNFQGRRDPAPAVTDYGLVKGKVLVTTRLYPEYHYGDELSVRCKLERPEPFEGFAYDRYLARQDIYGLCYYPSITRVGERNGNPVISRIYRFKARMQQTINRGVPEPEASLLSAIMLGSRRGLPPELIAAFNLTGLTHLIAISGAQITLFIGLLGGLLPYFGVHRRVAFYLVTTFLVVYLILIGAPASAVRAGMMGWILQFAYHVGRMTQAWRLLLYAAVAMVASNPKILRDDVGFQLSFAAVAGLVYLQPFLERRFAFVPEKGGLRTALAMTLAASVFTLPLVSAQFGRVSVAGLLANVVVFAIPSFAMIGGLVILPLTMLVPVAWYWLAWLPVTLALSVLVAVAEWFARLPGAVLAFKLPGLLVLPSYVGLAWMIRRLKRWEEEREKYVIN